MKTVTQDLLKRVFDYTEDGSLVWKVSTSNRVKVGDIAGHLHKATGYFVVGIGGTHHKLHRLVFMYHHGYMPEFIDHVDCDPTNNRIENLRECTRQQNQFNRSAQANNKLGVKGVREHNGKFTAQITLNRKSHYLGVFETVALAKECYDLAADMVFGDFARV